MRIVINPSNTTKIYELEPYGLLLSKLDKLKGNYHDESVVLRWDEEERCVFKEGFYIGVDEDIKQVPSIKYLFAELEENGDKKIFIRCIFENAFDRNNYYDLILNRVCDISLRLPYIFIPGADSYESECSISDKLKITMDVVVSDKDRVTEICCSILSHLIAIFSLDD